MIEILFASLLTGTVFFAGGFILGRLGSCKHKWEHDEKLSKAKGKIVLKCEHCGAMKVVAEEVAPCQHSWEAIKEGSITRGGCRSGSYYELRCKKCGEMTIRNLE